jgi:hypothetical protein
MQQTINEIARGLAAVRELVDHLEKMPARESGGLRESSSRGRS